jgi:hypothetical protein
VLALQPAILAVPVMTVDDLATPGIEITVVDNAAGDLNPVIGAITVNGPVGVWWINVDTGITMPVIGSPANPRMDLNTVVSSIGAGTIVISFSEVGFGPVAPPVQYLQLDFGGTTQGTAAATGLVNALPVVSVGPLGPGAFSGSAQAPVNLGGVFTMGLSTTYTHAGAQTSSGNAQLSVPEPSVMLLLGSGLAGLGGVVWRRKSRGCSTATHGPVP